MIESENNFYQRMFLWFALFFFASPFAVRALNGYFSIGSHYGFQRTFAINMFRSDSILIACLLLSYLFSSIAKNGLLKIFFRLIMIGINFFYCLDLIIFKIFNTRISTGDLIKHFSDIGFLPSLFSLSYPLLFLSLINVVIYLASMSFFLKHRGVISFKLKASLYAIAILMISYYYSENQISYFTHNWMMRNFIEINFRRELDRPYSDHFKSDILNKGVKDNVLCFDKPDVTEKKNIILLILESFSMSHSSFFSGINNYTPTLDSISREGRAFKNFYSCGFSTEHALISLFTGKAPIPGVDESQFNCNSDNFYGFYDLKDTLPKILIANGYHTEFLTSGNLDFSDKREWLKNLGFNYIEGHEAAFYKNYKRYHFMAAPDNVLYDRVIDRIIKQTQQKIPYFFSVESVSTHLPYIDPVSEEYSEKKAVEFADKSLGKFFNNLKNNGFFNNGILIIVSDHRKMTFLSKKEVEIFGEKAPALIPMVICGKGYNGVEKKQFQQTDIFSTIKNYAAGCICTSHFCGDFFVSPSIPPSYTFYSRGDNRSFVNVFSESEVGTIILDGDRTRLISGKINNIDRVINKINYDRIMKIEHLNNTNKTKPPIFRFQKSIHFFDNRTYQK